MKTYTYKHKTSVGTTSSKYSHKRVKSSPRYSRKNITGIKDKLYVSPINKNTNVRGLYSKKTVKPISLTKIRKLNSKSKTFSYIKISYRKLIKKAVNYAKHFNDLNNKFSKYLNIRTNTREGRRKKFIK